MRISVVGTGHVGLTTAACMAHVGHEVLGVDDDAERVETAARAVAREIHVALRPEEASRLESIAKVAPAAYDSYLRGRYLWNRRTEEGLRRSLDYFAQAVALDPKFAAAHAS